ncbi:MAG: DUF2849 domain-containing protein [Pseudomonadota bacterium]
MKAVTANRLADGEVVYLTDADEWAPTLEEAALFAEDEAADVLAAAAQRVGEIADVYLIDVADGAPSGRARLREAIRREGPTVRPDLARSAGESV